MARRNSHHAPIGNWTSECYRECSTRAGSELAAEHDRKQLVRYFVSFAHRDRRLKDDLLGRLKDRFGAARRYRFVGWQDKDIELGNDWDKEIQAAIGECDFGLLLVSPAFLGSEYVSTHELPYFVADDPLTPTAPKRAAPVALRTILFDGSMDLRGLEQKQIFRDQQGRAYQELTADRRKDDFADQLFAKIIDMLDKRPPGPLDALGAARIAGEEKPRIVPWDEPRGDVRSTATSKLHSVPDLPPHYLVRADLHERVVLLSLRTKARLIAVPPSACTAWLASARQ
jgi:hypothetical protein